MAENLKINNYHAILVRGKIIYKKQLILEFLCTIHCYVQCSVIKLFIAREKNKNKVMTKLTLHLLQYHIQLYKLLKQGVLNQQPEKGNKTLDQSWQLRKRKKSCGLTIKMKPFRVCFSIGLFFLTYLQNEVCDLEDSRDFRS